MSRASASLERAACSGHHLCLFAAIFSSSPLLAANDAVFVRVQRETKEGLTNVKEIAKVDGIGQVLLINCPTVNDNGLLDVLFIGPNDLSISLGYPEPSPDPHRDVEKVIRKVTAPSTASLGCNLKRLNELPKDPTWPIDVMSDVGAMSPGIFEHLAAASNF
ncbi:hypothetical protein B0H11DRAFT_1921708 [Mycena galericulata]|nr:hypothetical protein B0H11DRAFT_1921708 [Mycena galericulata]